jgi:enoyl-CoA hydratase
MQFGPNGVGTERRDAAHRSPSLRHALDIEHRTQVVCTATGDLTQSFAAFREDGTPQWNPL